MNCFFLTALALAPTVEKELAGIQGFIFERFHCPSALALLPVLPLFCGKAAPDARCLQSVKRRGWRRFSFEGCLPRGGMLCAQAQSFGYPGFYLADWEGRPAAPEGLPPLPACTVKTLRLLVLEMKTAARWWEGLEWETVFEDWIKLAP
ncbi:MAG: hypothetical protein LBT33_00915 [Spirochaetia bacterium]|jgi:hypothetical protein|nr:hypothetical protein [Spirochaetia bacterium]